MEINLIPVGDNPQGALAVENMPEGRCVVLTSHTWDNDFGSDTDLPGVKLPDNDTEAQKAHRIVTWTAPERRVGPDNFYITPTTALAVPFALRGGFDRAANVPLNDVDIALTWPGNQESQVIPSGMKVLLLGDGAIVTIPSGQYVYNVALRTPGARLEALNEGDDTLASAGKLSYAAAGTIAEVIRFYPDTAKLTSRMLGA
jgi:hypothetical protein